MKKSISKEQVKAAFAAFGRRAAGFAKRNYLMLGYIAATLLIELTGVAVTSGKFYMTEPWLFFTFVAFICFVAAYLPGHKPRYSLFMVALLCNFLIDMLFIIIYDSNGTVFDYAMISLRMDAMIIVESIPINFAYTFVSALIIALYGTLGFLFIKKLPAPKPTKAMAALTSAMLVIVMLCDSLLILVGNYNYNSYDLSYKLYQTETGTYSNKGIVGNMANELARGWWFSQNDGGDPAELEDFIYRETTTPSVMYGKARDYNVVTVLCESFEWFTFLCDPELYPNGFAKQIKLRLTEAELINLGFNNGSYQVKVTGKIENNTLYNYKAEDKVSGVYFELALCDADGNEVGTVRGETNNLNKNDSYKFTETVFCTSRPVSCKIKSAQVRTGLNPEPLLFDNAEQISAILPSLYPNLYKIYNSDSTVILNNSYSLEKTDISENKAIIGNYPLHKYINYAYPENSIPYSMPNMMKNLFGVESNSFHDGTKLFYNRNVHHVNALGFESYTSSEDMNINQSNEGASLGLGERNLDSEMFDTCKEKMFPTDRRFNTFVTTITQHGQYAFRDNLQEYYDRLDAYGLMPFAENDENAQALRYYCAAGMELDKAIGIMLDYLETHTDSDGNRLIDNTIITLFGDHNAYYQGVSNYAKDIYYTNDLDYSKLYRVPVMMKIGNLDIESNLGKSRFIDKFTCIVDILPTQLDLLGVTTYSNLTYGVTAFDSDNSSVLYSRAYDRFLTDKLFFNSINHIIYKSADASEDYIAEIDAKSLTLLNKISHINRIFASDFFKGENTDKFYENVRRVSELG